MPYFVTEEGQHPDCSGFGVVKADGELLGCHKTKQDAVDQMVAVSLAEGIEPGGAYTEQVRSTNDERTICEDCDGNCQVCQSEERAGSGPRVIISDIDGTLIVGGRRSEKVWQYIQHEQGSLYLVTGRPESTRSETEQELKSLDITYSRLIMNDGSTANSPAFKKKTAEELLKSHTIDIAIENDDSARAGYSSLGIEAINPSSIEPATAHRAVNLTPPAYMRAAARQGVKYYEEGKAGDGVVDATIREAKAMAQGNVTADKWVRIRAWIARHLVDLDAPAAKSDSPNYPSAGVVAHLLWGSGPSKRAAQRALAYAEGVVARLEAENKSEGRALSKTELRVTSNDFEVREDASGMTLTGYAARFNEPSEPLPFIERIAPGAFRRSLRSRNDIKLLWNHDTSTVLGSTRSGTLKLFEDAHGLRVEATLPDTQAGRDAKVLIQRGDVTGFSFGFTVPSGGDSWSADGSERTLNSVRLLEVSTGVAFPAYPTTNGTAQVRGLESVALRAEVDADALADALIKIEDGQDISTDEAEMLSRVITKLAPQTEQVEEVAPSGDLSMLALKKKKLELLMKGI